MMNVEYFFQADIVFSHNTYIFTYKGSCNYIEHLLILTIRRVAY